MAILASDINAAISAALPERAAEILPISPKPPIPYGEIAKNLSLFSLCVLGGSTVLAFSSLFVVKAVVLQPELRQVAFEN